MEAEDTGGCERFGQTQSTQLGGVGSIRGMYTWGMGIVILIGIEAGVAKERKRAFSGEIKPNQTKSNLWRGE